MDLRFWKKAEPEQRSEGYSLWSEALQFYEIAQKQKAMNLSAVYRAVEIISDSIAILPVEVKMKNGTHKSIVKEHPVNLLFANNCGNLLSSYMFMKMLLQSVMLRGNGYAYIHRANNGTPTKLQYLESADVNIHYNKNNGELYYTSTILKNKRIEPCNMIHLLKNSYNGVEGVSTITYAARTLGIAQNTENAAASFFGNGCNLAGIIKVQGQLTEQQKQSIRQSWQQAYANGGQGLAVLQGNMDYQSIQISAADSQMLESRAYNVADIARFFGISPVLLGDLSHSSYSTIEATQNQFLLHTLAPYIKMVEMEFSRKLLMPSETDLTINLDETELLKTDKTATASYYTALLNSGVMCINEVREELGYAPIEDGDKHIIAYTKIQDNTINKVEDNEKNI